MKLELVVEGRPVPKGSLRRGRGGRGLFFPPAVRAWEEQVKRACALEMKRSGYPLLTSRCKVSLAFYMAPTKGGKSPGRLRGDLDKLIRTILDAMTGVVYTDDELVSSLGAIKLAVEPGYVERVEISVAPSILVADEAA